MRKNTITFTDESMKRFIGRLLQAGVILSAILAFIGGILYLFQNGWGYPHYKVFLGEPSYLLNVRGILQDVLNLNGTGFIQSGILLLMATPVIRVAFSVLAFAMEGDRMYVAVTITVLLILLYCILGKVLVHG
jgi:uncharacterized membrane protein